MLLWDNVVGKTFKHAMISDAHLGTLQSSHDAFNTAIEMIGTNNWYWSLGGDVIEAKHPGHPHFEPDLHEGMSACIEAQSKYAVKKLRPIKKRCVGWLIGNHEDGQSIKNIMNAGRYMVHELGIRVPVAWTLKVRLAEHYINFYTHGKLRVNSTAGSPQQIETNEAESVKRRLWDLPGVSDADVVGVAHIHRVRIAPPVQNIDIYGLEHLEQEINSRYTQGHSLHKDSKWYCSTGSFMRTTIAKKFDPDEPILDADGDVQEYGTKDLLCYSERFMYKKTEIGFVLVTVKNGYVENVEKILL